jgi:hypothetical protein
LCVLSEEIRLHGQRALISPVRLIIDLCVYKLDNGSKKLVERFELSQTNLSKEITRKEFVESLHAWYKEYRTERNWYVDYDKYTQLDNNKYFKDVDLDSDF